MQIDNDTASEVSNFNDFRENAQTLTPVNPQKAFYDAMIEADTTPEPDLNPLNCDLLPVQAFDVDMLPDSLRDWVVDSHERVGCPIDYLAVGVMVSLATVIGRKVGIHPKAKDDWQVIPNLWACMIGNPSAKKSPAMRESTAPLERLASLSRDKFSEQRKEYEINKIVNDALLSEADRALKDASKGKHKTMSLEQAAQHYQSIKDEVIEPPHERRYLINDSTIEKLGELLNQNTNGLLMIRDELTGWLKSLDREDKASDRAFYLEAFNGSGAFTFDRIGRGTVFIESMTVSIFGGIQPSMLSQYLQGAISGQSNDGFVQRLQLAVYPDNVALPYIDRYPNKEAKDKAFDLFIALDDMPNQRYEDDYGIERVSCLRFTTEAQSLFNQWYQFLDDDARNEETPIIMQSHLLKYASLIPSLALILELADNQQATAVSELSLRRAISWGAYLRSHAMRIYGYSLTSSFKESAKRLIDRRNKLPEIFKVKQLQDKGWQGLAEYEQVKKVLSVLVEHGYLIEMIELTTGRPSISYRWNKNIKNT